MNRHAVTCLLGLISIILPLASQALGLGRVEQISGLNEPLLARIPVRANAAEWQSLKARLADAPAFRQAGVNRPHALERLRFKTVAKDGNRYLQVSTTDPVIEPVLDFLIRYEWKGGRLSKRYTLLFSPPLPARNPR